jgi:hypothetical protein
MLSNIQVQVTTETCLERVPASDEEDEEVVAVAVVTLLLL